MKMKKVLLKVLLVTSVLGAFIFVAGCSPVYQTNYSYVTPKSWRGKQCVNRCLRNRSFCRAQCRSADQNCRNDAQLAAMPAYLTYVKQQRRQGLTPTQTVSDFADYSACSDQCGCEATYRQCFTNCGGRVNTNTQCVAFCQQKSPQP